MNLNQRTQHLARHLRNRYFALGDVIMLVGAAYLSYVLRLERVDLEAFWPSFFLFTALAVGITLLTFRRVGIYSRYWLYASVEEVLLLVGSATVAALVVGGLSVVAGYFLPGNAPIPRSIPFIYLLLAIALTAGPRLALRATAGRVRARRPNLPAVRALVMGAGEAGSMIVREFRNNPQLGVQVVGFLDDDPAKRGVQIRGVRVLGTRIDIPRVVEQQRVDSVIIAMPTAPGKVIRDVVSACEQAGVQTKTIPGIYELLGGTVSVNQLRDVDIEDLLRREPVQTDTKAVSALLRGKRVLVTGAGGSIGGELCRQVLRCEPESLVLLGHGENSIFAIDNELRKASARRGSSSTKITAVIADIRDAPRMKAVLAEHQPHVIFHAAAHKHVHLMETNPAEAITNNVVGTRNLLDAALASSIEHFVMISTDKAVNPVGIMGASKRVAELMVHEAAHRSGKAYVAVRFGNVLASRGSVVLTFKQQIAEGGPVTITHEEMTRYFMTIPEAVQLVMQASALGRGGEVFMLDMGEPVKIVDMARDLIQLSGLEEGRDIDIIVTGTRPGEKLTEELFIAGEQYEPTTHEKIYIAANATNFVPANVSENVESLACAAQRGNKGEIVARLRALVPEFDEARSVEHEVEDKLQLTPALPALTGIRVRGNSHAS
ncbi:MAG TPA: nucleoside-diphosphate sugar epimerase/dehydratase [Chloroflexia bacterium]|nr:nucleoside-diphosphate sugar epimerase/dehydratase [Chloroflexia bacterium]